MNSYNENEGKNKKVKFREGKDTTEKPNVQNSDYGSISNDIDSIIDESSHDLNIETNENKINDLKVNVNTTSKKPIIKEEPVQILQQSTQTKDQNIEIKIEEDLIDIELKNNNKKTIMLPIIKIKKKDQEQLFPAENEFALDSNDNKSRIIKTNQTSSNNKKISNSKKSLLKLFSKTKKTINNAKIQSETSQKSPPFENVIEKPINENNPTSKPIDKNNQTIDNDILRLLTITDDLLGKLPEEVITEFASTDDFELYKQVMNKYQIGK